ncbi:MAG: hypothetical protein ABI670_08580 [Chloroflexota bacterium]
MASNSRFRTNQRTGTAGDVLRSEAKGLARLLVWWPVWLALLLFVGAIVAAYQMPHTYRVDVGQPSDEAYVRNFHTRLIENDTAYRWSDVYGYVMLPGVGGSRPFTLTISFDPGRPAPVTIIVNGEQLLSREFNAGWQTAVLRIDAVHSRALQSRDLVIEFRSDDYRTEDAPTEPKGVKVSNVVVEQDAQGGFIVPAIAPLIWLSASLLLVYLFVGRTFIGVGRRSRARLWSLAAVIVVGTLLAAGFAANHVGMAAAAGHIAITASTALIITLVTEVLLRRVNALSLAQCRALALLFAAAFALRYGGMALPQSVIIDMPYHMKWLGTLLTGDWQSLYFPGGLSAVPREWGLELLIPKSPLFYFAFAPLNLLPFDLETLVKWLISLLDSSVVLAVFWLSARLQPKIWAAIAGAALYGVMPLAFRAFAYGILPTIFSQWLATLLLLALVAVGVRKWWVATWLGLILLAALALLSFPTVAVFVTIVVGGYALCLAVWKNHRQEVGASLQLLVMLVLAWFFSIWAYYGLYVSPVLDSVSALLAPRPGDAATVRWPGGIVDLVRFTADYVVTVLPALLAFVGLLLLSSLRGMSADRKRVLLLVALWAAIAPLFFIANYKFDMIGKHLFFTMAPVALAGGVALFGLYRRGRWASRLALLCFGVIGLQALVFWIERLVRASS